MAIPVVMPKVGQTMTEGTIVKWDKRVGDPVRKGEVLAKIETDESETDVKAEQDGYLIKVDADLDQIVPCGEVIAWLGQQGEKI